MDWCKMGTYKIELILDGKSNIQKIMGDAGSSVKSGMDSIKNQTKSVNDGLSKVGNNAVKMGSDISTGSNKGASSLRSLGSSSTSTFGSIKDGAREVGTNIRDSISKGSSAGISALRQLGGTGASALKTIDGGIRGVIGGMGELETMLGAVIGGFGLMEIASMMWGGATQKQFNQLYLQTVMNKEEAAKYQDIIAGIVADVPGDDTFMNALLTGALARQSTLTVEELKTLGEVTAYYTTISKQTMGGLDAEYQREIKDYILTGNTGLMQRDGLLKNQMGILEGKATVEDRIKAINEALTNEGYKQIPLMELSSTKAEEVQGKFQLAATEIGTRLLPHITSFLELLIEIDEKTGGLSTQFMLIGGSVIALGGLLGMVYKPISDAVGAAKDLAGWIKDKIPSTKTTTIKCKKDPSCETKNTSESGGGFWTSRPGQFLSGLSLVPALSSTGTGSWAAMSGATAAGTVTGAGVLGLGAGFGLNKLDEYFASAPGGLGNIWAGYKGMSGVANPLTMMFGSMQTGAKSLENVLTGKNALDPIVDFFKGDSSGFGLSGLTKSLGGTKGLSGFKWPSASQILNKLKDVLVPKIPRFNWKPPSVNQVLQGIWQKINPLNWHVPGVGQLLGQTWQKIKELFWNIPDIPSLLGQTWQKIKELWWQVPSIGDILNIITSKITDFVWPMGPSPAGQGSGGGGGGAFRGPPRGPINNAIISTMSTKSGVGSGFIGQALANRFSGLAGFTPIANGIASRLGYTFYMGDQKSNQQVWDSGSCNCYDGAQFLQSEAGQRFGLGAGMQNGVWNGTSIPHTWSVIGGQPFDMAAKLIRGHWNPPSGPGSFDQFMTDIGPGLEYIGYGGHRVNPYDAISQGGNCFDMTLGVLGLARELWGMPGQMVWGHYDGMSHVWARIGNKDYDPTRRALVGSYTPPPQGPGRWPRGPGGDTFIIEFNGTVYGVEDLDNRTETMVKQVLDKREKKRREYSFGI